MLHFHCLMSLFFLAATTGCHSGTNMAVLTNNSGITQASTGVQDEDRHPAMLNPSLAKDTAPDVFRVKVVTTKGDFYLECRREWSPNGADRFYNMIRIGYFNDVAIFRAIEGFMFQFGIHGDPAVNAQWSEANIKDDKRNADVSNKPGFITFAKTGLPNSRSTQLFINLGDNGFLDSQGFTPFGRVIDGMDVVKQINTEYGENARDIQGKFQKAGNAFIKSRLPNVDYIKSMTVVKDN